MLAIWTDFRTGAFGALGSLHQRALRQVFHTQTRSRAKRRIVSVLEQVRLQGHDELCLLWLAICKGDWKQRIACLKDITPIFHAFDRLTYQSLIPQHLCDIVNFPEGVFGSLESGGLWVQ